MRMARVVALCLALATFYGCYAATVKTGLPASNDVIKKSFASSWIYGLVPPSTVETIAKCPNGVAIVETKLSFVNQVVSALTLGIYTPMSIVVTCAAKPSAQLMRPEVNLEVSENATTEEFQRVFAQAADAAVRTGGPVGVWTTH